MVTNTSKPVKPIPYAGPEHLGHCDGCQRYGKVRRYRGLLLCNGPDRCWRKRRQILAMRRRRAER